MTLKELEALEQAYGSRTTVRAVNRIATLKGIPIVVCVRCHDPELKSEAWFGNDGPLCRCCGRAERVMKESARRES